MKNVKIITIILGIVLITLVAFGGVYLKTQNRMEDKVKEYEFGRELEGGRVIEVKVVDGSEEGETKPKAEDLTIENYETAKKTIEARLNNLGAEDYTLSLNKESGTITVELPEDETTDDLVYYLTTTGKVQIKEKDSKTELLSDSMIEKAAFTYTSNAEGEYQVYMELELTDDGQAKIEEIKNNYAIFEEEVAEIEAKEEEKKEDSDEETTKEKTEEKVVEDKEETKKIAILTIAETEYEIDKIEENKVRVKIGSKTTNSTYVNSYIAKAAELSMLINSGKFPVEYEVGNNRYVYSEITEKELLYFGIGLAAILFVIFVVFIIKYRVNGLLASLSCIGFISLFSLLIRYTNVEISIEGIGAIVLTLLFNLRLNQIILSKTKIIDTINEAIVNSYKEFFLRLIPIIIATLVFCFSGWANLNSFGMIMFWGLMLIAIYNVIVTKTLLKLKENK